MWICPHPRGHLQAVGTDDAGRRQYLYHPAWRQARDDAKFVRVLDFGMALSKARERVAVDLGTEGMTRERGCAVAVRLLDLGYFRIGNDVYADENNSFGLTTLERRHARRQGGVFVFEFEGKSGVEHRIEIDDEATSEALEVMRKRRGTSDRLLAYKDGPVVARHRLRAGQRLHPRVDGPRRDRQGLPDLARDRPGRRRACLHRRARGDQGRRGSGRSRRR